MDYYEPRLPCDATQIGRFKRQRTILGVVMREVQRKLDADRAAVAAGGAPANEPNSPKALSDLGVWLLRAERIRTVSVSAWHLEWRSADANDRVRQEVRWTQ